MNKSHEVPEKPTINQLLTKSHMDTRDFNDLFNAEEDHKSEEPDVI